ncbi:MAG TPA: hypothetical protein VFU21_06445 [Kofleriaceae bacterium]|nr:hypothetical protein [Kofleriaceae bacterium]
MLARRRLALHRLVLPFLLLSLVAGTALGASASQSRGRSNRAAILKSRAARGEKGRVKTQFVRDTGKASLVKVMKLDGKGKATGDVEAYLVNKSTGVARLTDAGALGGKPKTRARKTTSRRTVPARRVASVAAAVAAPTPVAPPVAVQPALAAGPVVGGPVRTAARSAVMNDPMVARSESVAAMDPEAITPAEAMAMAVTEQRLKVTRKSSYDVVPTFESSRGDKSSPVTGSGMIELVATQKVSGKQSAIRRFFRAFNPSSRRRVEIVLDQAGAPAYMVDRADGLPYRIVRQLVERVPLREFANDLVRSDGVRKGGVIGILAGGLAAVTGPVGWGIAGVVAPLAWKSSVQGIRQRQMARQKGLNDAVAEIKTSLAAGKTVTIEDAYETYKAKLAEIKEGTAVDAPSSPATPISRRDFVKAISAPPHNL